jgi:hypothetical protein
MDMAGGIQDLAAFGASGQVKKLHFLPLGDTRGCPTRALLQLEEKLSFPMAVF